MYTLSSDNESSFATESETENEYFWNEESSRNQKCYTTEVEDIIRQNVDVTTANAIALNHHYQAKLRQLRAQLETLLLQCQTRLKDVDTLVDNMRYNRRESIPYRVRIPGYICGQPFFKDHELYPGPHNADYLYRKNVKKEFFPLDMFESTETHWTLKDKTKMKDGILKQVIEFLAREGELRAKMCESTSKAEQIRKDVISYRTLSLEVLWPKLQSYDDGKFGGQCFKVDWLVISNVNVSGRHTASACEGMWNQYLKPGLRKGLWKQEEECLLVTAVRQHNYQDWSSIAQSVGNRSEYQCFVHFRTCFSQQAHIERKPWTPEEDAQLLRIVQENCIGNNVIWNKVVEKMPNRNKVQVYHRYKYTLTRPLKGAKFTPVEDCVITAYVQQYGDDFKYFPEHLLPGRTMKQVWARYNNTLRYVDKHTGWTLDEDKRLMSYIGEHLTEEGPEKISWSDCSRYLVNHSRASCRTRYYTIEKFLEKYPNATLEDVPRRAGKKLSTDITHENWMKTIVDIKNTTSEINNSYGDDKLCETFKTTGEWALYDQMKFCFRYQFGHKLAVDSHRKSVHTRTKLLLHLLEGFHQGGISSSTYFVNKEDQSTMIAVMETPLDWSSAQTESKENDGGNKPVFCRIPPNYNTVLGLRGLCLNAFYDAKTHSSTSKRLKRCRNTRDPEYNTAVELFIDRFKAIFHWSMLLVKLNIDEIVFVAEEDQHAEAITISDVVDVKPCSSEQLPGASHVDDSERKFPGKPRRVTRKKHTQIGKGKSASKSNDIAVPLYQDNNCDTSIVENITIINPWDLPVPCDQTLSPGENQSDFYNPPTTKQPTGVHKNDNKSRQTNVQKPTKVLKKIRKSRTRTKRRTGIKPETADGQHSHGVTCVADEPIKAEQQHMLSKFEGVPQIMSGYSLVTEPSSVALHTVEPVAGSCNIQEVSDATVKKNNTLKLHCNELTPQDQASSFDKNLSSDFKSVLNAKPTGALSSTTALSVLEDSLQSGEKDSAGPDPGQAEDHNQIRLALREQQDTPSKVLSTSNEHSKDDLKISLLKKHAVDVGEPNVQHSFMNELIVTNRSGEEFDYNCLIIEEQTEINGQNYATAEQGVNVVQEINLSVAAGDTIPEQNIVEQTKAYKTSPFKEVYIVEEQPPTIPSDQHQPTHTTSEAEPSGTSNETFTAVDVVRFLRRRNPGDIKSSFTPDAQNES